MHFSVLCDCISLELICNKSMRSTPSILLVLSEPLVDRSVDEPRNDFTMSPLEALKRSSEDIPAKSLSSDIDPEPLGIELRRLANKFRFEKEKKFSSATPAKISMPRAGITFFDDVLYFVGSKYSRL